MDEFNVPLKSQASLGSESNSEETPNYESQSVEKRICLVGCANEKICRAANMFGIPIVSSPDGMEYIKPNDFYTTIFVLNSFTDGTLQALKDIHSNVRVMGPTALQQLAAENKPLPNDNIRPLYTTSMHDVTVCFTGFRKKEDLKKLIPLIHHMGGSIRKEINSKVTHLIANCCGGDKYLYAATFRVPIVDQSWVMESWERRDDVSFNAKSEAFVNAHKLKLFHGAKVCFLGFSPEEESHMSDILLDHGGMVTTIEDPLCTHVVMENAESYILDQAGNPSTPEPEIAPEPIPSTSSASTLGLHTIEETFCESNAINDSCFDITIQSNFNEQQSPCKRKRSPVSPEQNKLKRRRDVISFNSEKVKRKKISDIFKTPIGVFSHRRRTIAGQSVLNNTMNESSISTVDGLSSLNSSLLNDSNSSACPRKSIKKKLFSKRSLRSSSAKVDDTGSVDSSILNTSSCSTVNPSSCQARNVTTESNRTTFSTSVIFESAVSSRPDCPSRAQLVKAEWFWASVQNEITADEKDYLFDDYLECVLSPSSRHHAAVSTPGSASRRKRKRLHETLSSLAANQSPLLYKRRSSVSDAGLLSTSGSFLDDCTLSPDKVLEGAEAAINVATPRKALTPRHQVFLELLQTEINYVGILHTIMFMFKKKLEDLPEEESLLTNQEMKIIFGNLPPIYEVHQNILNDLRQTSSSWLEESSIGQIILKYSQDLLKAYPPYINFFEDMKEMLSKCDNCKPRFHAFLKRCQMQPECGRQNLIELIIGPVQRLGRYILLLGDILKHTPKSNPDHEKLDQALVSIREVLKNINEDKRKTDGQKQLFEIFSEIDNCPPDLVSSHRIFKTKVDVIELQSSQASLSGKGTFLALHLFTDQLEVCKKRSKAFTSAKSPNTLPNHSKSGSVKPYKHIKLIPLNTIKRVLNFKETEDCQRAFAFVVRNNDELKERLYSFALTEESTDKTEFLKTFCRQMADNACTADAEQFIAIVEPQELDINTTDVTNGTLSKAFKFVSRSRIKVNRAFSFNKTPSKFKRAVSTMMSPFGSSTNLTPATQLAQMKLASYSNLSELGNAANAGESPSSNGMVAPLSVQPTRKLKCSSLNANQLKRL